jgi:transposase
MIRDICRSIWANQYLKENQEIWNQLLKKDATAALACYRERNSIEVLFDDLKNQLDCERLRLHSSTAVYGRLFLQFIALILLTWIRKVIEKDGAEFSRYDERST